VARVAAGAIAKKILGFENISVRGYCLEIGGVKANKIDYDEIEKNPVRCPDKDSAKKMEERILEVKAQGDSVGGLVEIVAKNVPSGLGEPIFGKLKAKLADALMSIGAVQAVEIGAGMKVKDMLGSECNDPLGILEGEIKFLSNNAGGILGGISNGEDIIARIAVKPTPSISKEQRTVDIRGDEKIIKIEGNHDPCICPRIVPVAEAMVALVLMDYWYWEYQRM
jgi:chorismate synthase